jgi:hypothetical protein
MLLVWCSSMQVLSVVEPNCERIPQREGGRWAIYSIESYELFALVAE